MTWELLGGEAIIKFATSFYYKLQKFESYHTNIFSFDHFPFTISKLNAVSTRSFDIQKRIMRKVGFGGWTTTNMDTKSKFCYGGNGFDG